MNDRDAARLLNEGMIWGTVVAIRRGHNVRAVFVLMTWLRDLLGHPYVPVDEISNSLCRFLKKL